MVKPVDMIGSSIVGETTITWHATRSDLTKLKRARTVCGLRLDGKVFLPHATTESSEIDCPECLESIARLRLAMALLETEHRVPREVCPFCGWSQSFLKRRMISGADQWSYWAECSNCLACGPRAPTKTEAGQLWNDGIEREANPHSHNP